MMGAWDLASRWHWTAEWVFFTPHAGSSRRLAVGDSHRQPVFQGCNVPDSKASPGDTGASTSNVTTLLDRLKFLLKRYESLEHSLDEGLIAPLKASRRLKDDFLEQLLDLASTFDGLHAQVAARGIDLPDDPPVTEMLRLVEEGIGVEAWREFASSARSLLQAVSQIEHPAPEPPHPVVQLRLAASRLLTELPTANGKADDWRPRLVPFSALLQLVLEPTLDDVTAAQLETQVAEAFGDPLVRRSILSKLHLAETQAAQGAPADIPLGSVASPVASLAEPPLGTSHRTAEAGTTPAESGVHELAGAHGPDDAPSSHQSTHTISNRPANPTTSSGTPQRSSSNDAESPVDVVGAHEPSPSATTPVRVNPIPDELKSFEAFRRRNWLNPLTGSCETAPWTDDGIITSLRTLSWSILDEIASGEECRLPELWLASKSLEASRNAVLSVDAISSIAELISDPGNSTAGGDPGRLKRLRGLADGQTEEMRIGIVLEAIRPTLSVPIPDEERDRLVAAAGFKDGTIKGVVTDLLRAHAQGVSDPIEQLRNALRTNIDSKKDPAAILASTRKQLADELNRLQRNAGTGYVGKFDHCSAAWMEFMRTHARPLATRLQSDPTENEPRISPAEAMELVSIHHRIADECTVRDKSRKIMDRAAASLAKHLAAVAIARQEVIESRQAKAPPNAKLLEEAKRLLGLSAPPEALDRLAFRLLRLALTPPAEASGTRPLTIGTRFLSTYPAFLDAFDEPIGWKSPPTADEIPLDRPEIAAILLYPHPLPLKDDERKALESRFREEKRFDRLAKLKSPLNPTDENGATQEKDIILVRLQSAKDRLRKGWRKLEGLLVSSHVENRTILENADRIDGSEIDYHLVCAWLDRVCEFTEAQGEDATRYWREDLKAAPARLAALESGQYARATLSSDVSHAMPPLRETAWRHQAQAAFPDPRRLLLSQRSQSTIAEKWTADLHDKGKRHNALLSLLTEFTKWVFPPRLQAAGTKERTTFQVDTKDVRDYLHPNQPTYLPQLHDAKTIVVATVPESPASRDYRKQAQEVIRAQGENRIVILLCPGLTAENRDQIRRALHGTSNFAATVDDLDLVRLLNPEGAQPNLLVGLLEIALEQQPRKSRNPFALPQGKEMRLEMYVGRRDEAEQLATTAAKTRLFSGRKLGKTALLQFIRQTWNGRELPNGRTLRVVYLSIVGVTTEENFAKKMLEQLRLEFPSTQLPEHLASPSDIIDVMERILDRFPDEDMLFVLDEADAFVADQVALDAARKGKGLSWKLRDVERARFVFTGYWATATRDGVWYNWGDVLELAQLQPEEAAGLVANPLARMGIDAADLAPEIAFRCGYQPAVLLRFGEALIERLGQDSMKNCVAIGHELVQDVFSAIKVQKEIGGVVRANFQSNPFGNAVFCVVLRESARAPLGHWLSELEEIVVSTFEPLVDAASRADLPVTIATRLRDMHQRKLLLRRVRDGKVEYQLTFPHHLATLLQDLDIDAEIKANIRAWHGTHADSTDAPLGEGRSPVHRLDLATLRELVTPEFVDLAPKLVVVGSTWPSSLVHEPGGIPERLGIRLRVEPASAYSSSSQVRCWQKGSPEDLGRILADPPEQRPAFLFGDIALLRSGIVSRAKGVLDIEVVGTHRFTDGQVRWWFQRIMGVEFASESDYERVHHATEGVPFLIDVFQTFLMPEGVPDGGLTPTGDVLSEALEQFRRFVESDALAKKFFPTLTPRENELLRMISVVSTTLFEGGEDKYRAIGEWISEAWTADDFGEAWQKSFPDKPFPSSYGGQADDLVAIEALVMSGMARSGRDNKPAIARLFPFASGDPVKTLVNRFT
jgi:hypothetical protein